MAVNVVLNGINYSIPEPGDSAWGQDLTDYFVAQASGLLQKAGGLFTLTAEVDFGNTYGVKSLYFKSRGTSPASTGVIRLANTDAISWRNNANGADIAFSKNSSDQLTWAGTAFLSSTGTLLPTAFPALTGDVTTSAGSTATTVAKIQSVTVSGTTGTGNVVFSASPTFTGTITAATINLSSPLSVASGGTGIASGTSGGVPYFSGSTTIASSAALAQYGVVLGGGAGAAPATLAPNASTAFPLVSGGSSANPSWALLTVAGGGTGLASGTSGGILAFTASGTISSSGALTANQLIVGGGAGVAPSTLAAGSEYQVLVMGATTPGYGAVNLAQAAAVTGILPNANTTGVSAATASTLALRDSNANTRVNSLIENYTTTATAAGTTTLTVSSTKLQYFTGSTTQTLVLPDATTLVLGQSFFVVNLSSGAVTVNKNGGTLVQTMAAGSFMTVTVTNIGSAAGTWNPSYSINNSGAGTVTSVTFTGDGTILSSTPSAAVTTTGTVTASLKTQTANTVLAGPTTGSAANPTFRALVLADLPARTDEVTVNTANGYGSTNTKIRRFTNIEKNNGTSVTYADSATLGASFTINENGIYAIMYYDGFTVQDQMGISRNSTQLTTGIQGITEADRIAECWTGSTNAIALVAKTLPLSAGDVIRAHTAGGAAGASVPAKFTIVKVSN